MKASDFKTIILLGKSGSGKGTQAQSLAKKDNLEWISSGALLRAKSKDNDMIAKQIRANIDQGKLVPTAIIFHIWLHEFERIKDEGLKDGIVFEGSPRKICEAQMLDEVLEFYGWNKNLRVIYIDLSDKEAMNRLLSRGRNDDQKAFIESRLSWFKKDVEPVIDFYKKKGVLLSIDGEQSIEKVHEDILAKLK